jgi:hypothetical protein
VRSVVQLYPGPPLTCGYQLLALSQKLSDRALGSYQGAVAQLGERLVCNQEATGSIPVSSTKIFLGRESMEAILSLGGLLVPIVAILVGGVIAVTTMVLRHQERIAKIERGIDPDGSWPQK